LVVQRYIGEEGTGGVGTADTVELGEGEVRRCYNDRFINL
jgi:hypothetical protein